MAKVFKARLCLCLCLQQQGHTSNREPSILVHESMGSFLGQTTTDPQNLHKKLGLDDEVAQWIKIFATNANCLSLAPGTQLVGKANMLLQIFFRSPHVSHAIHMVSTPNTP